MTIRISCNWMFLSQIAVNLICADEGSDRLFGLPFFGDDNQTDSNRSSPFSGFFDNFQLPSFLPFNFGSLGSRQVRSAEESEEGADDPEDKFLFGSIVSCNYTTQVSFTMLCFQKFFFS